MKRRRRVSDAARAARILREAKALEKRQRARRAALDKSDRELEAALEALRGKPKRKAKRKPAKKKPAKKKPAKRKAAKRKTAKRKARKGGRGMTAAEKAAFVRRMAAARKRAARG